MKIVISVDSACDMPKELMEKNNIVSTPYYVTLADKEFLDTELTAKDLYDFVGKTGNLPKTAAISADRFEEYFDRLLKEYDQVIHLTLSDAMTSSGANARTAAKGKNVFVVDSASLSSGIALIALRAAQKVKAGKTAEEIVSELNEEKKRVQASFLVDTLKYLHKGGRCSSIARVSCAILKIKPKISVIDGKMEVTKKYIGNINNCLIKYVHDLMANHNPDKTIAFCTHSSEMPISAEICKILKEEYGFNEVYDCFASSTISTHCGPNTLGVLFVDKE